MVDFCIKESRPLVVIEYKAGGVLRGETTMLLRSRVKGVRDTVTFIKKSNDAFASTNIDRFLSERKIKTLLLLGINVNACVQDTAIGALRRKYKVITAKGLIASSSRKDMGFSKKNESWYMKNVVFAEDVSKALQVAVGN